MIIVEDLGKAFLDYREGWLPAVERVSFTCRPGEVFGLLGPNGAGKTTTLRMIATVLRPTSGRVLVDGHDVVKRPDTVRSRIGYLSGSTALYDRMSPRELVHFFGRLYRMTPEAIAARTGTLFAWLDIDPFADKLIGKLSTGQRQKASIARALIHDPPVLVFDEPTSGLDVLVARSLIERIGELRDQGKTILFSTHAMHEVEKLCDHMAIIHRGSMLAEGTPGGLLSSSGQPDLEELFFALVREAERHAA